MTTTLRVTLTIFLSLVSGYVLELQPAGWTEWAGLAENWSTATSLGGLLGSLLFGRGK